MCTWLAVSRAGFYEWRSRPASATAKRRVRLSEQIARVFAASRQTYGHRRVHAALARLGVRCSLELVRHLMRAAGLQPCQPRPFRVTTVADADAPAVPDRVQRQFMAAAPGRRLVGDITYIATWEGFVYLATVIDCCTKMVIGWALDTHMRTDLVTRAIDMAAGNITIAPGAVFHSDRGTQGGFQRSSQHLDDGGVLWRRGGSVRRRAGVSRLVADGSGRRIGRCGRRCVRRGGRSRRVRCSVRSGG
jgi:putative transposase